MKKIFKLLLVIISVFIFIPKYNCETYTEEDIINELNSTKVNINELVIILDEISDYSNDTRVLFNDEFLNSLKGKTYQEKYDLVYERVTNSNIKGILDDNETKIVNDMTKIKSTHDIVYTYLMSHSEDGVLGSEVDGVFSKIKDILKSVDVKSILKVYYDMYENEVNTFISSNDDIDKINELIINDTNEMLAVYNYIISEELVVGELVSEYNLSDFENSIKSFINFNTLNSDINNVLDSYFDKVNSYTDSELNSCKNNTDYKNLISDLNNKKKLIVDQVNNFKNKNVFSFLNDELDNYNKTVNNEYGDIIEDVKENVSFNITVLTPSNGSLSVDNLTPKYNQVVNIIESANEGYVFKEFKVYKTDGSEITSDVKTSKTSFKMPYYDVRVSAVFSGLSPLNKPVVTLKYGPKNSIIMNWKEDVNAEKYLIYRSTSKTKGFKLINTIEETTYTDTGLTYGKTYYYIVKAVNQYNEKVASSTVSGKAIPDAVSAKINSYNYHAINMKWSKASDVTGYVVYRSTSKNGTYKAVKTITKNSTVSFTNKKLTSGKTYYYKIRTYKVVSGKKVYGRYSNIISEKVRPKPVSFSLSTNSSSSVKVSWSKVSGASGYKVYECDSSVSSTCKTIVKKVSKKTTSATISGLTVGEGHYYIVKAYRTSNGKNVYSDYVTPKEIIVSPKKVSYKTTLIDENTLKLTFTKENPNFITQIKVNGSLVNTLQTTYIINNMVLGKDYQIELNAFDDNSMTKSPVTKFTYTAKPYKTKITSLKALGSWKVRVNIEDTGADSYEIYRKEKGGWYLFIADTKSTSYVDDTARKGVTYYYKVRGVKNGVKGDFSSAVKVVSK